MQLVFRGPSVMGAVLSWLRFGSTPGRPGGPVRGKAHGAQLFIGAGCDQVTQPLRERGVRGLVAQQENEHREDVVHTVGQLLLLVTRLFVPLKTVSEALYIRQPLDCLPVPKPPMVCTDVADLREKLKRARQRLLRG